MAIYGHIWAIYGHIRTRLEIRHVLLSTAYQIELWVRFYYQIIRFW